MSCTGLSPNLVWPPSRQVWCAREFVQTLFGRPSGRGVVHGKLPKPCPTAYAASMSSVGICPNLFSTSSAAKLSCTGICPNLVWPPSRQEICPNLAPPPRQQSCRVIADICPNLVFDRLGSGVVVYGNLSNPCSAAEAVLACTLTCTNLVECPSLRVFCVLGFVETLLGRLGSEVIMYGNLSKPCLAAQSADM